MNANAEPTLENWRAEALALRKERDEISLIVERQREAIMFAQVNATAFPDECAKRLKETLALPHPSNELSAMRKVIEAAESMRIALGVWDDYRLAVVDDAHIYSLAVSKAHHAKKLYEEALAELDRSRGGL